MAELGLPGLPYTYFLDADGSAGPHASSVRSTRSRSCEALVAEHLGVRL